VQGLPSVFHPGERRWVKANAATVDEIAEVIARCPSGALHFERLDDGAQEVADSSVTITLQSHGPLYAHGHVRVISAEGALLREDTRVALCGCGQSANKPFCDNECRRAPIKAPV
jgi:CDGSH-type Zn-finger protein